MHSLYTELCSSLVFALLSFTKPFQIESDKSYSALGGIITQKHASVHKSFAFLSKTVTISKKSRLFIILSYLQPLLAIDLSTPTLIGK